MIIRVWPFEVFQTAIKVKLALSVRDKEKVGARVYREEFVQERAEFEGEGSLERGPTKRGLEKNTHLFLRAFDRAATLLLAFMTVKERETNFDH